MHFADDLSEKIHAKGTALCVGIDPQWDRLPKSLRHPRTYTQYTPRTAALLLDEFCSSIVKLVAPHVPAIKINAAFFEPFGDAGFAAMQSVIYLAQREGLFVILDGKRNDIASSASLYAQAAFGGLTIDGDNWPCWHAHACTVNPYLGQDAVDPFVSQARLQNGGVFVLVRTSNPGAGLFQDICDQDGKPLFLRVGEEVQKWSCRNLGECGFGDVGAVVGATRPGDMGLLRQAMPNVWFLVPGFGAQGGNAESVRAAFRSDGLGALVNSSRDVIFAFHPEADDWKDAVLHACLQTAKALSF